MKNCQRSFCEASKPGLWWGQGRLQPLLNRRQVSRPQSLKIPARIQEPEVGGSFSNYRPSQQTHAADHFNRSGGCVRMAAFVKSFKISGSSPGIFICSGQYRIPSALGSIISSFANDCCQWQRVWARDPHLVLAGGHRRSRSLEYEYKWEVRVSDLVPVR